MRKLLLSIFCCALIATAAAQNEIPEIEADKNFDHAYKLHLDGHYSASRSGFEQYVKYYPDHHRKPEAQYYIAYNAINEGLKDAEFLMQDFVSRNPSHPKAKTAFFNLGNQYFSEKKWSEAIRYYGMVNFNDLPPASRYEGQFKLGYSQFMKKSFEQALVNFEKVTRFDNPYTHDAQYYAGYIHYQNKDHLDTIRLLRLAEEDPEYEELTAELVATSYLALRQYDELLQYINQLGQVKLKRSMQLMTAEAYFNKEDYTKASELYQLALSRNSGSTDPLIYYHQGFADLKIGREAAAIEAFKLAALSSDTIGQYGSYYLGILYTGAENKQFALNAFEKAAGKNFNRDIQEESAFRVGQLNYELGQFAICIDRLTQFTENYSGSAFESEANDLISEAYLKTSNYDQAIRHIENLKTRSRSVQRVYQQVTLMKGNQLFNDSQFLEAIGYYDKSINTGIDGDVTLEATYWKSEAYSIGEKWVEAINGYSKIVFNTSNSSSPFYNKSRYGLGYAYFNTKVYDRAKIQFAAYTRALHGAYDQPQYLDGLVRLGDCYFVEKNYSAAIGNYENALRGKSQDKAYIYFQLGLNYGFQGNLQQSRRNFNTVINSYGNSRQAERSSYQLAQLEFEEGNYDQAAQEFTRLINNYTQSRLVPYALVKRAVAYYNLNKYDASKADYETVLDHHITHEVANSALLGLQELASVGGQNINLDQYIARYREANPDDNSLESVEFEAAKSRYFSQDYTSAIERFRNFNERYSESSLRSEALYFIADAYNRSGDGDKALEYFYQVLEYPDFNYFNRSVRRVADLEFERQNYDQAVVHYQWLYRIASNKRERYQANEGLMLSYQAMEQPDSVVRYANRILGEDQISANGVSSANLYLGKAAMSNESFAEAISYFEETAAVAEDQNAAEATYLTGKAHHLQGDYTQSNEVLFTMNEKYASYENWLGRSFLLIADNYLALDELFQAEATLNSIIENSPDEEIKQEARVKLEELAVRENEIIEQESPSTSDSTSESNGNE